MPTLRADGPFPQPFGRYTVRQFLGGGGMASVYLATDTVLDIPVALKVPHPERVEDASACEQFLHEARALAQLEHENVCRVHDFGALEGTHYLCMRYVPGRPLSEVRQGGQEAWPPSEAAEVVHTLAVTMAFAHARGIIHRDLKPSNVLVTPEGKLVVTDFGLALRLNRADARVPQRGEIAGTLPYMPPEAILIGGEPVGPACDIYSLGVILYELLTGRLPFLGKDFMQLLGQIHWEQPTPPAQVRSSVPPVLQAICLKALSKRPQERFASMDEFARALALAFSETFVSEPKDETAVAPVRPPVARETLRYAFTGYGAAAPPSTALRDRLYLDVGGDLRPGVIDHHQLLAPSGSTARLVLNRPDLLDASVARDRRPGEPFTFVVHDFPDLDSVASVYLAASYLAERRFPAGVDLLVRYVDKVDEGSLGMSPARPFSLYAAYRVLADRPAPSGGVAAERWQQCLRDGQRLLGYVLEQVAGGTKITHVDAFACPGLFGPEDRGAVEADLKRYERKLADPRCAVRTCKLDLPGQFGGTEEVEALLARDVQNEHDPERCLFFKDWARGDAVRCRNGSGFQALCVFVSEGVAHPRRCFLSVTPDSKASLRGLGELLDQAEAARRRQVYGCDDRDTDPTTGTSRRQREGYDGADPWYDGRGHGFTIVDAPRGGTILTVDEIEALFLKFGKCASPARPLGSPVAG